MLKLGDKSMLLEMHLDRCCVWKDHILTEGKQLHSKNKREKEGVIISNKVLIYKAIIEPIRTYSIQLRGTTSYSNINIIQYYQAKTLRTVLNN